MEDPGLARNAQSAGQEALGSQAASHGLAHRLPDLVQEFPDVSAFALRHVFPEGLTGFAAMYEDLGEGVEGVDGLRRARFVVSQRAAAQAVDLPGVGDRAIGIDGSESHAIRMQGEFFVWPPDQFHRHGGERLRQRRVGHMAFARGRQAAVERDPVAYGVRIARFEPAGRALRGHGVAAGWPVPDAIELVQ